MPQGQPKRTNPNTKLIAELEELVLTKQAAVDSLAEERRVLRARAAVAHALVAHCEAIIALSDVLEHSGGSSAGSRRGGHAAASAPQNSGSDSQGSTCAGPDCPRDARAAAATAASTRAIAEEFQGELARMKVELRAARGGSQSSGGGGGPTSSGNPSEGAAAPALPVHWWPEGMLRTIGGGGAVSGEARGGAPAAVRIQATLLAFKALVLDSMRQLGCVLP